MNRKEKGWHHTPSQYKNNMKKPKISIGIPAYFAEKNIKILLEALVKQEEKHQTLLEIIVYSDGSTDDTIKEAKKVKDKRIRVIDAKKRKGMVEGFIHMLSIYKGDYFLLLNDDVYIDDKKLLEKIFLPLLNEKNIGLVSGSIKPFKPLGFVEKSGICAFNAYDRVNHNYKNGNTKYTCDGKILLLSNKLTKMLLKLGHAQNFGTLDAYLYFFCITKGLKYRHVKDAIVWFRYPQTLKEYINWTSRNNSNKRILAKTFGSSIVRKEYNFPKQILLKSKLIEAINHPIESVFIFFVGQYCNMKSRNISKNFNRTWDVITTTKDLKIPIK